MEPIITWIPWKPVNMKKDLPKVESEIEKKEDSYSTNCKRVKINPNTIVKVRAINDR